MKVVLGSPVLIMGGDGRKGHVIDIVLVPNDQNNPHNTQLVAMVFVKFEDGGYWHGGSHWLSLHPEGVYLTFKRTGSFKAPHV